MVCRRVRVRARVCALERVRDYLIIIDICEWHRCKFWKWVAVRVNAQTGVLQYLHMTEAANGGG